MATSSSGDAAAASDLVLPSYPEMIVAAIAALAEDNGSSQAAIARRIEAEARGDLPASHPALVAAHLARMSAAGELVAVVGGKYALPPPPPPPPVEEDDDDDEDAADDEPELEPVPPPAARPSRGTRTRRPRSRARGAARARTRSRRGWRPSARPRRPSLVRSSPRSDSCDQLSLPRLPKAGPAAAAGKATTLLTFCPSSSCCLMSQFVLFSDRGERLGAGMPSGGVS